MSVFSEDSENEIRTTWEEYPLMTGSEKMTDYMKFYMAKITSSNFGLLWKEMLSVSGGQSWTNMRIFFTQLFKCLKY